MKSLIVNLILAISHRLKVLIGLIWLNFQRKCQKFESLLANDFLLAVSIDLAVSLENSLGQFVRIIFLFVLSHFGHVSAELVFINVLLVFCVLFHELDEQLLVSFTSFASGVPRVID